MYSRCKFNQGKKMKILAVVFVLFFSLFSFAQDDSLSRNENIKLFNEAQECYRKAATYHRVEAMDCAKRSLEIGQLLFEPESLNIAVLTINYGLAVETAFSGSGQSDGQVPEAGITNNSNQILQNALALYEGVYGEDAPELIDLLITLKKYSRALDISEDSSGDKSISHAETLLAVSLSLVKELHSTNYNKAIRYARSAYEIFSREVGTESSGATLASFLIGKIKLGLGRYKSSIPYLLQATKNPSVSSFAHAFLVEAFDRTSQPDKATLHAQKLGERSSGVRGDDYMPLFHRSPDYPLRALERRKEGYVVIELTISKEGLATSPVIIEEEPKGYGFGKAALKAAHTLRYVPRFINGEPVKVSGVLYKYSFKMAR